MIDTSKDLRTILDRIYSEVSVLTFNWMTFKELFSSSQERLDLLQQCARSFFRVYREVLLDEILLSFSRLTDPPKSVKGARVSLRRLLLHISNVDKGFLRKWTDSVSEIDQACSLFRVYRNNQLAHVNLQTVLNSDLHPLPDITVDQIDNALKLIQQSITQFSENVLNESYLFQPFIVVGGPVDLVNCITRGIKGFDEDHKRFLHE